MPKLNKNHIWYNHKKPLKERVDALVDAMTLREKIAQMVHHGPPIPRLGVPSYNWSNECLHGVARAGKATVFPQGIGMGATFNEKLIFKTADAISDEARAKHHEAVKLGNRGGYFGLNFWTPNINIVRDPRWGRAQETYGECPHLTARIGVAFCKGLQGDDPKYLKLVATPKHYAVHSGPESLRHEFNAVVSQRDLHETYLPQFKACVQEAGAWSVMGAYNRLFGDPCCGSKFLLQDILRDEWGFKGFVVSDCKAIRDIHEYHKVTKSPAESSVMAVKNGCDLNCGRMYGSLLDAVKEGQITEEEIAVSVKRLFEARFRLGMFDPDSQVPYTSIPADVVHCEKHVKLARKVAQESIVLLKNNGILPLAKGISHLAVIGPNMDNKDTLYANYCGSSPSMVTPLDGILDRISVGANVLAKQGCHLFKDEGVQGRVPPNTDAIVAVLGNSTDLEAEDRDRADISLPGMQLDLLKRLHEHGKPIILVLLSGSAIDLTEVEPYCEAILMAWYPGEQGGNAIADVIFGDYNPAGRLPVTFVKSMSQLPDFCDYAMKGRTYRFMKKKPLYRFGYGLSYTKFSYRKLKVKDMKVTVEVKNTGKRDGDEVVQVYVSDNPANVPTPLKQLVGFRRIHIKAGKSKSLTFRLKKQQLAAYDSKGKPFVAPGAYTISVGGGQPDDPASGAVSEKLRING